MIKALVFDLDGTLVDTLKDLAVTTNEVLKKYNYSEIEIDKYRYFVGNGIRKLIEKALIYVNGNLEYLDAIYKEFINEAVMLIPPTIFNNSSFSNIITS